MKKLICKIKGHIPIIHLITKRHRKYVTCKRCEEVLEDLGAKNNKK